MLDILHTHSLLPAQFLAENIELLPRGRAFDVAMGSGQNAVYLAKQGYKVEGADISAEAVHSALELAQRSGTTITANVADLEGDYHIRENSYDVIICFHYLQRSLMPQIKAGLKQGGMVVYETFIVDQARLFGKPSNPDYLLKHNELLEIFRNFRCLRYREGVIEGRQAIASIVAQKV